MRPGPARSPTRRVACAGQQRTSSDDHRAWWAKFPSKEVRGVADDPDVALSDRVWTIPNLLSVLRLGGIPLFLWLVLGPEGGAPALIVLAVAGLTDYLDGQIARRLNQTSRLGQLLDPIADRLYILAVVVGFALRDIIPTWLAIGLPLRDVLLIALVPFLR